ncbi:Acyltransferase 3 [Oceaniovalibus guishaninsula JLT2003]|uniref:Acyltransferase 3 n=2 Tax=Oceaniovalibus TaxID=1207070 RepID=K2I304_9RHOB|nr:Acyltransferase 3 [Oceaniovalibus guishaninsula JLT2003]
MHDMAERSEGGFAAYHATRRFGSLDGLRFLCIMAVLWHHAPVWTGLADPALILTRGFAGVDFFFVLSGFLITTLLVRERRAKGRFSLRGFYWRRFLRIVPLYFLIVTAVAAYYIGVKKEMQYLEFLPFYYLFLSNFLIGDIPLLAPTWSLSVEEQYYLVWPLLLLVLPRRWVLPALVLGVVLCLLAVTGSLAPLGIRAVSVGPLVFYMFNATYAPILIGSALAILLDDARGYAVLARVLGHRAAPLATFGLLLVLWQILPGNLIGWPNLVMHLSMAACLASIVIREDHVLRPVLAFRPVARVGEISYGIYLYHLIGLHVTNVALGTTPQAGLAADWAVFVVYTLVTIAISEVSFRTFEQAFLRLKRRPVGLVRAA